MAIIKSFCDFIYLNIKIKHLIMTDTLKTYFVNTSYNSKK